MLELLLSVFLSTAHVLTRVSWQFCPGTPSSLADAGQAAFRWRGGSMCLPAVCHMGARNVSPQ